MKLTKKGFKAWLESHEPVQIIGYKGSNQSCPLAHYLHELGHEDARVGTQILFFKDGGADVVLPEWAARFVDAVDEGSFTQVTAGHALKILEG